MVIQTTLFTRYYSYRVVYVCSFSTKYHSFLLKLIYICSICGHFLTGCKQPSLWPLLCKKNYTTVYFPWISHSSRGKYSKISKCFSQVFKGFKYNVFKQIVFVINVVIFQPMEPTVCIFFWSWSKALKISPFLAIQMQAYKIVGQFWNGTEWNVKYVKFAFGSDIA